MNGPIPIRGQKMLALLIRTRIVVTMPIGMVCKKIGKMHNILPEI
jgi:hypothetical protein